LARVITGRLLSVFVGTAFLTAAFVVGSPVPASSAAPSVTATLVRTSNLYQLVPPVPDSAGIAYLPGRDRLLVSDSEVEEMSIWAGVNIWELDRTGHKTDTGSVRSFSNEPTGLGFDSTTGRLFISDDVVRRVFIVLPGTDGRYGTSDDTRSSFDTRAYGNTDPEDIAFDTANGDLFTSDGKGTELYRLSPGSNGTFDGVPPTGDDVVSHFDVGQYGVIDAEGLGYDPYRDTLLVGDRSTDVIYEVTAGGSLVRTIDISGPNPHSVSDVAVAPSTVGNGTINLFVVQRGIDNNGHPNENDGKMYEFAVGSAPPTNQAPVVSAGPDRTVTFPAGASLSGSVRDDGLPNPPGAVTAQWSKVSGPGTVTFADPASPSTTATFSAAGTYVLRLTADDSALTSSDEVTVTSSSSGGLQVLDVPIRASSDDAEDPIGLKVRLASDIDMVDVDVNQTVGLRYTGIPVPAGATIVSASVQFRSKDVTTGAVSLTIRGQATDDPGTFTTAIGNISSRSRTTAGVSWVPPAWPTSGVASPDQRTPDLSSVIQEIMSRPGWSSGNALVIIVTGSGLRTASSFDNGAGPILHLEYTT
jgi:K319-like protein